MDTVVEKVIAGLTHRKTALQLTRHQRNRLVKNTNGAYYYLKPNGEYQVLSGLLPRLKAVFWPQSDFYSLRKAGSQVSKPRHKKKTKNAATAATTMKVGGHGKGRHYGSIRGTEVHRQLKDFIELDEKNFLKRNNGCIHEFTKRILLYIVGQAHWRPLCSEFDIFDAELGIGTSVDLVCVDKQGQLILLEIKTGYRDYFQQSDGHMRGSLCALENTPQHWAYVQLMAAAMMIVRHHMIPLARMQLYVLRVDEENLDAYALSNDYVQERMAGVYQDLLLFNNAKAGRQS